MGYNSQMDDGASETQRVREFLQIPGQPCRKTPARWSGVSTFISHHTVDK